MTPEKGALEQYLDAILAGDASAVLERGAVPQEQLPLAEKLQILAGRIQEATDFATHIANGELEVTASRENLLLGPLKDLQSSLRHMLWAVQCIADGDYSQNVAFLGDFSIVLNTLAEQSRLREAAQRQSIETEKAALEEQNALLTKELEQQVAYYERMQDMHQQLRMFRHDLKNHCVALSRLLTAGDIEGASGYVESMFGVLVRGDGLVNTGNPLFDAILSEKFTVAKEMGIAVESQLTTASGLKVDHFDWCVLLGNALDNAIEACQRIPEGTPKRIWVKVRYHKGMLNVTVQNSALPPITGKDGAYQTTKANPGSHGLGLKNIEQVAEKYDGVMQTEYRDGEFTLRILLCGV